MANDLTSNHTDNSDLDAILSKDLTVGSSYAGHSSYSSDNSGKAWEYDLYKVGKSPALYDLDAARETQKLLWQPGDLVSTTDYSAGNLAGFIDNRTGSLSGLTDLRLDDLSWLTDLKLDDPVSADLLKSAGQEYEAAAISAFGQNTAGTSLNARAGAAASRAEAASRGAASSRGGTSSRARSSASQRPYADASGSRRPRAGASAPQRSYSDVSESQGSYTGAAGVRSASAPQRSRRRAGGLIRRIFLLCLLIILITAAYTSLTRRGLRYLIYRYTHDLDLPEDLFNDLPGDLFDDGTSDGKDKGDETDTDGDDDITNPYPDGQILTQFGYDYSDFYTPKYIASYDSKWIDTSDHKYQELCVIDSEPLIGTGHNPVDPGKNWWANSESTSHTLGYYDDNDFFSYGFTVRYADSMEKDPFCFPDLLVPPATADQNAFRQKIIEEYTDDTDNYDPGFKVLRLSKVEEITIDDHNITYTVVTGEDKKGNGVADVLSFEKKPLGSAFITEYRYRDGEFADAGEALRTLYGMLDFRRDSFEYIDASNTLFPVARVYNSDNSCAAKIDLSRLGNVRSSEMTQKNRVDFELGEYGEFNRPTGTIRFEYQAYGDVDYYGSPEEWAAEMLGKLQRYGEYPEEVTEENLKKLRVFRCDVYSLTLEGVEERDGEEENVVNHLCRIETPEGGEIMLDLEFVHDIPEDFDMEQFLRRNVKIESGE